MGDATSRVETPGGPIEIRTVGQGTTVLFVHGLMVNGHVWDPLIDRLRDRFLLVLPDLPLGGHRLALRPDADCGLAAHAERVIEIARQLTGPVVLVGSDTGGAIAQMAVTREPELFDRLVLLPSDAFDNCPPKLLTPMRWLAGVPGAIRGAVFAMRLEVIVRATMKLVSRRRSESAFLDELLGSLRSDRGVQRDFVKLLQGLRPEVTNAVAAELPKFRRPVLIAWSRKDPLFPLEHAHRLAEAFPDASVVIAENSRAFISIDEPEWLADRITEFAGPDRPGTEQQ
ncbi:MAG: alpha/beta fold hydrolase [Kibdelosporangium sp.]